MNYFAFVILGALSLLASISTAAAALAMEKSTFLFNGACTLVLLFFFYPHLSRFLYLRRLRARNFDWYRSSYPEHFVRGNVQCSHCNSARVHNRPVQYARFMREHYCGQCGTTLYYSEQLND